MRKRNYNHSRNKSELDKLAESIGSAIGRYIYKYVLPIVFLVIFCYFLYGVISSCVILNPSYQSFGTCIQKQISFGLTFGQYQ